ncbi:MAG: hypothetical protein PHP30_07505, partial [Bacteroidales bacterium]|nr:hypothetical protein [Bacteroidales bacterium]
MEIFDFISDPMFKSILERDFQELDNCVKYGLSKSALVLSGSIIEAVLLEYFTHNLPDGMTQEELLRKELYQLIEQAVKKQLISERSKQLSIVIKNYRNLIHPGREIRKNEEFDNESATVSLSLVKVIVKEVRENYKKLYGYKAEDIYQKITCDSATFSIFDKLLIKLNNHEKIRLIRLLVNHNNEQQDNIYPQYREYIYRLKSKINKNDLLSFCKELHKQVEQGKEKEIIILFEFFGDCLDILQPEEKDLILMYIYNLTEHIHHYNNKLENNCFRESLRHLRLYKDNQESKQNFLDLLQRIVGCYLYCNDNDQTYNYFHAYNLLSNSSNKVEVEEYTNYIKDNLSSEKSDA